MTDQILFHVPKAFKAGLKAGRLVREGVRIRNVSTGHFVGFLQESGPLARHLANLAGAANPLVGGMNLLSSFGANVQNQLILKKLEVVRSQLQEMRLLTGVGAATSALNLGVSAAGFVMVLRRLDAVGSKVEAVSKKLDWATARPYKVRVLTEVRRSQDAFDADPSRQREIWSNAERALDESLQHFMLAASGSGLDRPAEAAQGTAETLFVDGRLSFGEATALLDWLLATARARLEALLLLGDPGSAERLARFLAEWLGQIELDPVALVDQATRGRVISPSTRMGLLEERAAVSGWVEHSAVLASSKATAARAFAERGVDTRRLVEEVRAYPEPALLLVAPDGVEEAH